MNKRPLVVSLIAVLLAALIVPTSVRADTTVTQFDGETVLGWLPSTDGCFTTNVYVQASNRRILNPPSPKQSAPSIFIGLNRYDNCNNQLTFVAFGDFPLADGALQMNGSVKKASLDTTVNVYEQICGCYVTAIYHLKWMGDDTSKSSTNIHYEDQSGLKINITDKVDSNIEAEVSGNVTVNGVLFGAQTGRGRMYRGLNHAVWITP